jgi:peptidoglycan/LPS O-acetylase OafA/YrhL
MNSPNRIYFLDNLRAFVILLVVVLHGSMTYMAYAPSWWYVLDPQNSLFFTSLILLLDIPIMLIMFFIAGYFALPSLSKRGPRAFLKEKFIRVGMPWIVGVLLLAPPTAYLIYYSRAIPITFFQFWTTEFWGEGYQQSVYWFLGILLFFFLLLSLVYTFSGNLQSAKRHLGQPSWKLFAGFWALMTLGMFLMNQLFPVADAWFTHWYILVFQPLRLPLYLGYFILGLYAYLNGWFSEGGYQPRLVPWAALAFLSGVLYLGYRLFVMPASPEPTLLIQAGYAVLFNTFCLSALLAGVALFQQKVNRAGPFWGSLALNAYGIYFIHPLILYPLAYIFVPVSLSLLLKAPLVITLGLLISWAISALVLARTPLVQRAFA